LAEKEQEEQQFVTDYIVNELSTVAVRSFGNPTLQHQRVRSGILKRIFDV
jgi:hypothetical protein